MIVRIMNFAIQMSSLIYNTQLRAKLHEQIKRHQDVYVHMYIHIFG